MRHTLKGDAVFKNYFQMTNQSIVGDLNRKDDLEKRVLHLARIVNPKKAVIDDKDKLLKSLLDYDPWDEEYMEELNVFCDKYAGKTVEIFEQLGDYFILEDNNYVLPKKAFMFVNMFDEMEALSKLGRERGEY